jgi:two-component system nitrate/nitrite response regulator NarL
MSTNNQGTAIAVVHSNALFRAGLASLLARDAAYQVSDASNLEVLEGLVRGGRSFDAVLIELSEIKDNLSIRIASLRSHLPDARVALLSRNFDPSELALAFSAAADGIILESVSGDILLESLKLILLGEKLFPSPLARYLSSSGGTDVRSNGQTLMSDLSERELEILRCLVDGDSNKRIANRLNITEATVKVHLKSILRKTHVMNRTQAAIWALHRGVGVAAILAIALIAYDWNIIELQAMSISNAYGVSGDFLTGLGMFL